MYAKGNISTTGIAKHLNAQNIQTRIKLRDFNIYKILGNETYTGTRYFNTMTVVREIDEEGRKGKKMLVPRDRSEWVGVPVPAIISKELFDEVQKRLKYNHTCFRNARGTHLLSNLVFCAVCKGRCVSFRKYYAVKRKHGMRWYYHRFSRCPKNRNGNRQIDVRLLEQYVREMVQETLVNPELLKSHLPILTTKRNKAKGIKKQLEQATKKLAYMESQQKRIVDLYAKGGMEQKAYYEWMMNSRDKIETIQAEQKQLRHELPLFKQPELIEQSVIQHCANLKQRFKTCSDFASWRQFFLDFIEGVEYSKNNKIIKIAVRGSVPVIIESEEARVGFVVRKKVPMEEAVSLLHEMNSRDGTVRGESAFRSEYHRLTVTV